MHTLRDSNLKETSFILISQVEKNAACLDTRMKVVSKLPTKTVTVRHGFKKGLKVTNEQALDTAKWLWGKMAFCDWLYFDMEPSRRYCVGDDGKNGTIGYGSSWEEAFKDAGVEL